MNNKFWMLANSAFAAAFIVAAINKMFPPPTEKPYRDGFLLPAPGTALEP